MAETTASQESINRARERYNSRRSSTPEVLESDSNEGIRDNIVDLVDMLKKNNTQRDLSRIVNPVGNNILPLKSRVGSRPDGPIPVTPIDPTSSANQARTNSLLQTMTENMNTVVPQPLQINAPEIAHEVTLARGVSYMRKIADNTRLTHIGITQYLKSMMEDKTNQYLDFMTPANDNTPQRGFMAKMVDKLADMSPLMKKLLKSETKFENPLLNNTKQTALHLAEILKSMRSMAKTDIGTVSYERDLLENQKKQPGALESFMGRYGVGGGILGATSRVIDNFVGAFKRLGDGIDKKLETNGLGTSLLGLGGSGFLGGALRLLGFFGTIGGLVTAIVGSAVFASAYAMFKNPDQLVGMMGALGTFMARVLYPTFEWISREILPPLGIAFAALLVAGEWLLDTVGTVINKSLIFIIGTALPEILGTVGRMIDALWQGLKGAVLSIAGIFGVGPNADKGIVMNIIMAFGHLGEGIYNLLDEMIMSVLRLFGLADFFGINKEEGVFGRIARFFTEDIPNFANEAFTNMMDYINELSPVKYMKEKIKAFTDAILSIVPSWDDIKSWVADSIPSWVSDSVRNWIVSKLNGDKSDNVPTETGTKTYEEMVEADRAVQAAHGNIIAPIQSEVSVGSKRPTPYAKSNTISAEAIESVRIKEGLNFSPARAALGGLTIVAPQNNNSSVVNNTSNTTKGRAIGTTAPPLTTLDERLLYAN